MEISDELKKEFEKLADLEFEYNVISKFAEDEAQLIITEGKLKRQMQKIRKIEEKEFKEALERQKEENKENVLEQQESPAEEK